MEGEFEGRRLPPSTYEIVVDEPGYEPAQASGQLDGTASPLVLYLNSPSTPQNERNSYTVSARELKIPDKARKEYIKGLGSLGKNDLPGSVSHFTKAAQAFPDYYEAFYHISVAETRRGPPSQQLSALHTTADLRSGQYARDDTPIS